MPNASAERTCSPFAPPLPNRHTPLLRWHRLWGGAAGLAITRAAEVGRPLVVVTPDARSAQRLDAQIRFFSADNAIPIWPFPDWECLPYDNFSPHQDIVSQRLLTLHRMPGLRRGIVIVPISNLMQRIVPPEYVHGRSFVIAAGDTINVETLRSRLQDVGYHSVGQVFTPGEYSIRGGLIDVFPMGSGRPFRLDLFGDVVESIRFFDQETQRSVDIVQRLEILPGREVPLDTDAVRRFRAAFRARFEGDPQKSGVYRDISKGLAPAGIEFYLPLFFERCATLFDYLSSDTVVILDDGADSALERVHAQILDRYELARLGADRPVLTPAELYLSPQQVRDHLQTLPRVDISTAEPDNDSTVRRFATHAPPAFPVNPHADHPYAQFFDYLSNVTGRVLLVAETPGRRETFLGLLRDHGFATTVYDNWGAFLRDETAVLGVTVGDLEQGVRFDDPALSVLTESQLYGERVFQRRRRSALARDPESIIRSLAEIQIGDPIVHEEHGVGRYRGLRTLTIEGDVGEFLAIEYHGGDKLYIPVLSLDVVSRYVGGSPEAAPLHKLGSEQWVRAKRKARQRAYDVATELLEVQALRQARAGHAFSEPDDGYRAFAAMFPFEETPDQAHVIDDVIADMISPKPMDRLVCGDVGFGKTEIAMRAAFLAVHGGRQVALLVPTTLLAQQHYQNFCDRFADFPVRIELLSRFRSKKDLAIALRSTREGLVDILIGTHRLLQKDVTFKALGLLIIDEEHRFGVRQKERLKQLRNEVDILTLTATPIPRTLNISLSGLREISIIATPPRARLSVKTFVREWNTATIREACLREIRRGGQVYFLHNEVRTIHKYRNDLQNLVPEAEIRVAHGQMPERELEQIMRDFYHQRFNVLLCTTIIESGIDVPSANTIIINRADRFGLAQLHQLRGRVGRSHHQAYAYLLTPPPSILTADAAKRLQAIASLEDLGAGFSLASHDLEIRGAGELLGEAQSGTIDEIGFTLYTEFLNRAIASIRRQRGDAVKPETATEAGKPEVNLHVPALFPEAYLPDVHLRLIQYKRIANARSVDELNELKAEVIDRFGLLPEPAKNLFRIAELRFAMERIGIVKAEIGPKGGRLTFREKPELDPGRLIRMLQTTPQTYRMQGPSVLMVRAEMSEAEDRFRVLQVILHELE